MRSWELPSGWPAARFPPPSTRRTHVKGWSACVHLARNCWPSPFCNPGSRHALAVSLLHGREGALWPMTSALLLSTFPTPLCICQLVVLAIDGSTGKARPVISGLCPPAHAARQMAAGRRHPRRRRRRRRGGGALPGLRTASRRCP